VPAPFASRLAFRLTLVLAGVSAIGMLVMGLYVARALERLAVDNLTAGLVTSARLVHDAFGSPGTPPDIQPLVARYAARAGARVTVIAIDGTVLGDSEHDPETMENHLARPEVQAALSGGTGTAVRRSRTVGVDLLYVAIPLEGPSRPRGVVRLAVPLTEVAREAAAVRRAVQAGAVLAIVVALGVGFFVSRRVTRPVRQMRAIAQQMAEGDLAQRVAVAGGDEVGELGQALNRLAAALAEKVQTLEAQRAEVSAILEGMVEGVIALDGRDRVLLLNPGARAMLALGDEPLEGRALVEVIRHKGLLDLVEACRRGPPGERYQREIELGPAVDRTVRAHAVAVPFGRERVGMVLVLHDVTELRRLERVRAEFVANVSHELRTPLTAMKGYLETLLDGALDEPAHARRFLDTAHRHADRLGRLVDDLLQLSDVESGRAILRPEPVELREVAATVAAMFEGEAARKALVVANDVPARSFAVADRDRLIQILVNLVDNAVKYTPEGGRVTITAARAGDAVELTVADTGIGIPSTDLPRISERFYRVDKARSRELGGTGLGLAIVKHLVQSHGGALRIQSELGKGTTVRVTLPAVAPRA
jgi:two-component system phosphate regulon sensor histidine kinase PhoR